MHEPLNTPYECIEPTVGAQIGRLERADLDPEIRATLEAHVATCHACHHLVRLDRTLGALMRGPLDLEGDEPGDGSASDRVPRNRPSWLAWLALAASLAAVFTLPPRPVTSAATLRGAETIRFLSPVEGEVLAARRPVLRWTPVPGATQYQVELRDEAGQSVWKGASDSPAIRLPARGPILRGHAYRALLSVQPADLLSPGLPSVRFRSESFGPMAWHRLRWAHPLVQGALALALAWVVLAAVRRPSA